MKQNYLSYLLISLLILSGCNNNTSTSQNENNNNSSTSVIIKSPNEDGGLEGNQEDDQVEKQGAEVLKTFLEKVSKVTTYTYDITSKVIGNEGHFVNYFTTNAWYEENDDKSKSFGYAKEVGTNYVFKYYLSEDETTAIPSVYEYEGLNDDIYPMTELFGPFSIAHVKILQYSMEEFDAINQGLNRFLITDTSTSSVFQYMTTFGSSITNYIVATYIDIIDSTNLIFKVTCDLGEYGSIEAMFTPSRENKISFVNEKVNAGELKGISYHEEVNDFLNNKINSNNFILRGIKQRTSDGIEAPYPYEIHCTNDYFYLDYNPEFVDTLTEENKKYCVSYGYALVPKNTPITYYETQTDGTVLEKTQTLSYTSCYGFKKDKNGNFIFDYFKGPLETNGLTYKEVDELPLTGEEGVLYIIEENNKKVAYEYRKINDGEYGFAFYSNWFNSVGDFYINDSIATFYLSGTALSSIGRHYFEKSITNENEYYSKNVTIIGALAHSLFGWGFQATNTWMDYIENARIKINKDSNNNIESYDIILDVLAKLNGSSYGIQEVYYTISDFGNGNVEDVEVFLNNYIGGEN